MFSKALDSLTAVAKTLHYGTKARHHDIFLGEKEEIWANKGSPIKAVFAMKVAEGACILTTDEPQRGSAQDAESVAASNFSMTTAHLHNVFAANTNRLDFQTQTCDFDTDIRDLTSTW